MTAINITASLIQIKNDSNKCSFLVTFPKNQEILAIRFANREISSFNLEVNKINEFSEAKINIHADVEGNWSHVLDLDINNSINDTFAILKHKVNS